MNIRTTITPPKKTNVRKQNTQDENMIPTTTEHDTAEMISKIANEIGLEIDRITNDSWSIKTITNSVISNRWLGWWGWWKGNELSRSTPGEL